MDYEASDSYTYDYSIDKPFKDKMGNVYGVMDESYLLLNVTKKDSLKLEITYE